MSRIPPAWLTDARGLAALAAQATLQVTHVVEGVHRSVQATLGVPAGPQPGRMRGPAAGVYSAVRGITRLSGITVDGALALLQAGLGPPPSVSDPVSDPSPRRDAWVAALNGVIGDHLADSGSALATPMQLRYQGTRLDPGAAARQLDGAPRLLLMIHGLCMSDLQWNGQGGDGSGQGYAERIAAHSGSAPLYLRYNSGQHISDNGRALSALLQQLVEQWPGPPPELDVLAHSMGGLVLRSACEQAQTTGAGWLRQLRRAVFLGTPHHGAPLERAGNLFERSLELTPYSAPFARLGRLRSAGITDLRHGNLREEDWQGRDRFAPGAKSHRPMPLPAGVVWHCIAASRAAPRGTRVERLLGDDLVPLASALGQHPNPEQRLRFAPGRRWIAYRTHHMALLNSPAVEARLLRWLAL